MTKKRVLQAVKTIFVFAFIGTIRVDAQSPPVIHDPLATAIVGQALAALGGEAPHTQVRTAIIRGTQQASGGQPPASFVWEDDLSGSIPEFRKEIRTGDSVRVLASGHGAPSRQQEDGTQRQLATQVAWAMPPLYLPGVVLVRQLKEPNYSFELIRDGGALLHVRTAWALNSVTASITAQDWYFDPATKIPLRVQYSLPSTQSMGTNRRANASLEFADFRILSGMLVPFRIVSHSANSATRTLVVEDVQLNVTIDKTHFEMVGGQQ